MGSHPVFDTNVFLLFLAAAVVIAVTPGPGVFYVAARTLAGGRDEGWLRALGRGWVGWFMSSLAPSVSRR